MSLRFVLDPDLTPRLRAEIVDLWVDVSNAGGAVGFVPPVNAAEVHVIAGPTFAGIVDGPDRLLVGYSGGRLAAMLIFSDNRFPLKAHWCVLKRVMVHPDTQGAGYGSALMVEAARLGRVFGHEALHITVRDGLGLDKFYGRLGYREIGRLPGALRVAADDDRDEILMWLDLTVAD
ncbi:GNAT family N-acetyltransferase [Micromonospora ureilytica]|uniref:GNAT superfamily N-acetyltransferase n=1 Tax=Micromonospora ureilytica TaxID=709868 RepID=A0ABS0JMQ6_9ACTN|nr:GNAT family N-acetyltransferase [Micromonospora ureilytica]MBG6067598.1 GNAT superfamily N-acetyltransferase [Micromonospora ureilytica]WSR58921.1 GNAT family N-acetyltransferase [Micromonospora ureilytica]